MNASFGMSASYVLVRRPNDPHFAAVLPETGCAWWSDDEPPTIIVGHLTSDEKCARFAALCRISPADLMAFRDDPAMPTLELPVKGEA
ncbi:hypothetical protein [Solimonas sp. SE-A11]|uniref:hypothetical protein n=1 Tax=Solimonas sp. SE-A11 TaxID=3054954 RepID=UPI00259CE49A|nr:hypothetical protein [Solimonas sp. SE-A11]MDM4770845.1 hypothetical protein [Solimonas sp. SE-A11]